MYKKCLFHIWEVWAYLLWLRWKLGLLFRKGDKKYLQMVNCRSMDYTLLSSYSKQGDDLTNCFYIKKGMQRNGAWLRYAMRSFIQTKNGCHCPCNCLGWHTTITASTTMRRMGISLNECMIFRHFIMKFLK